MSAFVNFLLFPVSLLYKALTFLDWQCKYKRRRSFPGLFIISVDNLTFGGSGKTTLVSHIASILKERKIPFSILSRGYKSAIKKGVHFVSAEDSVTTVGDESLMQKKLFPESNVVVSPDRLAALEELRKIAPQVVILDDGFQSAHIVKDLSLLLDTPLKAFSYYRNFRFMARRADVRLEYQAPTQSLPPHPPNPPAYTFKHLGLRNRKGEPVIIGSAPIVAFSALGDNKRFLGDLQSYKLKAFHPFPDHHFFDTFDIRNLKQSLLEHQAAFCVCTLKDFVKLPEEVQNEPTFIYAVNGIQLNFNLFSRLTAVETFRDYFAASS